MKAKIIGFVVGAIIGFIILLLTNPSIITFGGSGITGWVQDLGNFLNQTINPGNTSPLLNMISTFLIPFILPILLAGLLGVWVSSLFSKKDSATDI